MKSCSIRVVKCNWNYTFHPEIKVQNTLMHFRENQLTLGLSGILSVTATHPPILQHLFVWNTRFHPSSILVMERSILQDKAMPDILAMWTQKARLHHLVESISLCMATFMYLTWRTQFYLFDFCNLKFLKSHYIGANDFLRK